MLYIPSSSFLMSTTSDVSESSQVKLIFQVEFDQNQEYPGIIGIGMITLPVTVFYVLGMDLAVMVTGSIMVLIIINSITLLEF